MKKALVLLMLSVVSTGALAKAEASNYKKYDPKKNVVLINAAIIGPCEKEHQKSDSLKFNINMNYSKMTDAELTAAVNEAKEAERQRWYCLEKELNKSGYTLDLEELFEMNQLNK